jgi:hypothetical protein
MLARPDRHPELANALPSHSCDSIPSRAPGWQRLAAGFLHLMAALGLGMLAAGSLVVALIWFSLQLPNG